ncbi:uncharacterized protein LOC127836142 isoform X2 [Dreissena polymorpha]|nr:uncharacterized protein LOC127836142 isoform X2 [Dreissena polymorpha]
MIQWNKHNTHHFGQHNPHKHWVYNWVGTMPIITVMPWIAITPVYIFRRYRYQVVQGWLSGLYPILVNRCGLHTIQTHASTRLDARHYKHYRSTRYLPLKFANNVVCQINCRKKQERIYLPSSLQTFNLNGHNIHFTSGKSNESPKDIVCVNRSITNMQNENHNQQVSTSIVEFVHKETENNSLADHITGENQSSEDGTQKCVHGRRKYSSMSDERYLEDEEYVELNLTAYTANDINNVHSSTKKVEILKHDKESSGTKFTDNRTASGLYHESNLSIQQTEETDETKLITEPICTSLLNTVSTLHLQIFNNANDSARINSSGRYTRQTIVVGDNNNLRKKKKSIKNITCNVVQIPPPTTVLINGDHTLKKKKPTTDITCKVIPPAQKAEWTKLLYHGATDRVLNPRNLYLWIMPATNEVFVEELRRIVEKTVLGEPVPAQESMRFELLRSCTYRTFPKDGKPDVRKLAEAGFYYASNSDEVICYCCYKRISNWKADDDPMAIHRRISPECRFFTDAATVNVTKEFTAQVESEIMAKIQGGRQRNTTTQSAQLQTRKDSQSAGNIADAGVSLRQSQPARAHGQFAMAHSGETSLPMHQPPVNTRESTKYLSMMPQMARNETAPPNRSHFQTGVFVPQDNFRVPVIDTRAVQPSDDTPGQDTVIDEHVRETLFRIEEVSTSVATSSARAETSRATTEQPERSLDSLIRSDASVLVQGMGYELPIVRRALTNLLERGQTRPDAQEIMNEIFLIEDGTTN